MTREMSNAGPAIPAAGAITAKMPTPKIAAIPVDMASKIPSWGRNLIPSKAIAQQRISGFLTDR
jgi:hypothetical protein